MNKNIDLDVVSVTMKLNHIWFQRYKKPRVSCAQVVYLDDSSVRPPEVGVPLVAHAPVEEAVHAGDVVVDVLR
jgi:hypothetical protein